MAFLFLAIIRTSSAQSDAIWPEVLATNSALNGSPLLEHTMPPPEVPSAAAVVAATNSPTLTAARASSPSVRDASEGLPSMADADRHIEIVGSGAVARYGSHKVNFATDLNAPGAIDLTMTDRARLQSRIFGLAYISAANGQIASVLIAELKDVTGELTSSNEVLYPDAFDTASCDVLYKYSDHSFEQNIIIRKQLPTPADFGMDPATVRLAVLTEFYDPPQPTTVPSKVDFSGWNQAAGITSEATLDDELILFNTMRIVPGRAFTLGETGEEIPVVKSWRKLEGRQFLIEATPYILLEKQLKGLPPRTAQASPPKRRTIEQALLETPKARQAKVAGAPMKLAMAMPDEPGVVLDYLIVSSSLLNVNFGTNNGSKIGFAYVGQTSNDFWNGYDFPGSTNAALTNLKWSDTNSSSIGIKVQNAPNDWNNGVSDGMYGPYIFGTNTVTLTLTNIPTGTYDFYLYGHGPTDAANSIVQLVSGATTYPKKGTTIWSSDWNTTNWQQGQQVIAYRSVSVTSTQAVTITISTDTSGYAIISGLQMALSSGVANPAVSIAGLINLNFGSNPGDKVGKAAVGLTTNDTWTAFHFPNVSTPYCHTNVVWSDGYTSGVGVTVTNAPGEWNNFVSDGMYSGYIYPNNGGNIDISITNLPAGTYDFYVYGHSPSDSADSLFQVSCGTNSYPTRGTTIWGSGWNSTNWEEGQQYVVFRSVPVATNTPVRVIVLPDTAGYAIINGIQIILPPSATDSDSDGIPDWWEIHYGLNPHDSGDASADTDGDGVSNYIEYLQGRNPRAGANLDTNGVVNLTVFTPLK